MTASRPLSYYSLPQELQATDMEKSELAQAMLHAAKKKLKLAYS